MSLWLRHQIRASLWAVPLLCVLASVALSFVTVAVDRHFDDSLIPASITGPPDGVSNILITIASAMITLTTLVLTVTTVAVQLAMGQFSPRIVHALLHDRSSQLAYGLFASTFTFAILALREVGAVGDGAVPGTTVLVSYLLMGASIVVLFLYIHHSGNALRAAGLIDLAGDNLHEQLDRLYPADPSGPPPRDQVLSRASGLVIGIDRDALVDAANDAGCLLEMVPMMGEFVPSGGLLFRVHDDPDRLDHEHVADLVVLGAERTHSDDPTYGFRKLVDIAERSIAQPFTDPTTAIMVIDRLHDCLRQLAPRRFPSGRHHDAEGHVRLIERTMSWDGYVRLAFDELRIAGVSSAPVPRRLRAALDDLKTIAPPERHPALDRQLALLTAAVERTYTDAEDVRTALVADQLGIGSGPDLDPGSRRPPSATDGTVRKRVFTGPDDDHRPGAGQDPR